MENENTIPKRIFYSWLGGGEKSQAVIDCINTWKKVMPDYEIAELNEFDTSYFDFEHEYKHNKWFKTCYENKIWAYTSDYARIKVLYDNGGIYFDTDVTAEKSFDDLIGLNKLALSWYNDEKVDGAVIVSPKHHKILKKILEFYDSGIWNEPEVVMPEIITKFLKTEYELKTYNRTAQYEDCIILPPEYFYPMPVGFKDKEPFITGNTHTVHWWGGSWLNTAVLYFIKNKHLADIEDLTEKCFKEKVIYKNALITVKKRFSKYSADIDLKNFQINISRILRKRKARNGE